MRKLFTRFFSVLSSLIMMSCQHFVYVTSHLNENSKNHLSFSLFQLYLLFFYGECGMSSIYRYQWFLPNSDFIVSGALDEREDLIFFLKKTICKIFFALFLHSLRCDAMRMQTIAIIRLGLPTALTASTLCMAG